MRRIVFLLYMLMTTGAANAQDLCTSYIGKTVALTAIETAIAGLANLTPRGEFETTAQFKARRAAELRGVTSPVLIRKAPESQVFFKYDADAGVLRIESRAFDFTRMDLWSAFFSVGLHDSVHSLSNITVVITTSDKVVGSYEATNAYGAKVKVVEIQRKTSAIFDRKSDEIGASLFPAAGKKPYGVVGELVLPPAEAQRLKPQLKLAFVVTPKEPYLVTGSHKVGKTTVTNPRHIIEDFSVLVANIQCGLVMDGADKVLGAYATR